MAELVESTRDFLSQPWGVVGAFAIMAAVTVMNFQGIRDRLNRRLGVETVFNGLNLIGGVCLLVNAVLRDEVVWLVLETYFIAIAVKGLLGGAITANRRQQRRPATPFRPLVTAAVAASIAATLIAFAILSPPSIVHNTGQLPRLDDQPALTGPDEVLSETEECDGTESSEPCVD